MSLQRCCVHRNVNNLRNESLAPRVGPSSKSRAWKHSTLYPCSSLQVLNISVIFPIICSPLYPGFHSLLGFHCIVLGGPLQFPHFGVLLWFTCLPTVAVSGTASGMNRRWVEVFSAGSLDWTTGRWSSYVIKLPSTISLRTIEILTGISFVPGRRNSHCCPWEGCCMNFMNSAESKPPLAMVVFSASSRSLANFSRSTGLK